ncbi:hypothetical protein GCM10010452_40590 [Crossiella cryophila]|uniref:6-deoxyerythronolide-B synthase n=1 Tax=Crossiella cryophila TaxID=43355 RepID=A0A7W7CFL8_9PSEU|nr:type I polyketide synthase [Crossiella cryophila]MBB4680072.1 acyl transferase domain-containing protein [Crossiella cryophila]
MTDPSTAAVAEALRDSLREVSKLRRRNQELTAAATEPLAIVGMSCRYPGGVNSPEDLWQLLIRGGDAIGDFPADRGWRLGELFHPDPAHPGTSYSDQGGFLGQAAAFDPEFFGISPREALAMDPQQRLLLETSWEALERAGLRPESLRGSRTGVFAGVMYHDYGPPLEYSAGATDGHRLTGTTASVLSGRIAYTFGFEGPAVTVDTACSSSLVAIHLAAQALRNGDCELALAGGVTVMSTPGTFVEFSRQRGLSTDGRCRSFAADADGTGWSEGVGVLVLETLSRAQEKGHRVLAVLRGSAVNSDGASSGLTAPNGPSQQRVIRQALATAGLSTVDIAAVEAHGTGTRLGDPIEAQALLATYGQGRAEPLLLGSLKSNLGHTQAAAGVGGVIKMVLALRHGLLPETLHVREPSPLVDWSSGSVALLTEARPWPEGLRRAAVSSFGISGTNAHVIIEQAPEPAAPVAAAGPVALTSVPIVVSGRGPAALRAQAGRLAGGLAAEDELTALGASLAIERTAFEHRATILAKSVGQLRDELRELAEGDGEVRVAGPRKVVFVFPGQGPQWPGMAVELLETSPVFAGAMAECAEALRPHIDFDLLDVLRSGDFEPTEILQPTLFAVMVSLAALWKSVGVVPDAVVGTSQGEMAAAVVAGALSLADAARAVALRSKAIAEGLTGFGGMLSVALPLAEVEMRLAEFPELSVAALNGPSSTVVAGAEAALVNFAEELARQGVWARRVPIEYPSHTAHVELIRERVLGLLEPVRPNAEAIPFHSTVTGDWLAATELTGEYWYRNLRRPIRFEPSVRALLAEGFDTFVECSPHPVLLTGVQETIEATGVTALAQGTVRRGDTETDHFLTALGALHEHGVPVDWTAVFAGAGRCELPTYAFQHSHFWLPSTAGGPTLTGLGTAGHPLLSAMISLAGNEDTVFTGSLTEAASPESVLDLVLHVAALTGFDRVDELRQDAHLDTGRIQVRAAADGAITVFSRAADDLPWTRVAIASASATDREPVVVHGDWPTEELELPADAPAALTRVWRDGSDVYAEAVLPEDTPERVLHPELLAAVFAALDVAGQPVSWRAVRVHLPGATTVRARLAPVDKAEYSVLLTDLDGAVVATVGGVRFDRTREQALPLYEVVLTPVRLPESGEPGEVVYADLPPGETPLAATTRALELLQTWIREPHAEGARLVVRTGEDLASAAVGGLVRSAQTEYPDQFVLLESDGSVDLDRALATGEPRLVLRDGQAFAPRLSTLTDRSVDTPALDGTVLITGGTGVLGALVARHLVTAHGVRHLLLASRRGPAAEGAAALRAELESLGARVTIAACDAADRDALAALLDSVPAEAPLVGVVHTAGVVADAVLASLTPDQLARVQEPKITAALNLHELTDHLDLALFALFSSYSGLLGNAGQAAYASANAFLDALAQTRREQGKAAISLAWGLWAPSSGVTGQLAEADLARLARAGIEPLSPEDGLALFDAALSTDRSVVAPVRLNLAALRAQGDQLPALLRGLVRVPVRRTGRRSALAERLRAATESERARLVLDLVRAEVATVLGHADPGHLDLDRAFRDLGFDSLTAVDLRNRLAARTGLTLSTTLVFDHPSPAALAAHLITEFAGATETRPETAAATPLDDPIAIVAMSCRFPGGVDSPEDLWRLLEEGGEVLSAFPDNRGWDLDRLHDDDPDRTGTSYARTGGFLHQADRFDAAFFGIPPVEALAMDPQQRILLEVVWEAFERAGLDPTAQRGSRTGVFIGTNGQDYGRGRTTAAEDVEGYLLTGTAASVLSGRVSYTLGLSGPAVTVDTACSSALVAVDQAVKALRSGECGLALAGGISIMSTPTAFVQFSRQRGLAPDGRCKAFAAGADGTGWSEGAGILLLERLSDARRNGHQVLALVRGSAVNSDGASNGLTAPNGPAQQRVIRQALAAAGLRPSEVDMVEAHGTGTALGDPIEAQALLATYGQDRDTPLLLGAVKSNLGHTQAAAGVAGVIKSVLALRHGVLPRSLHLDEPSPHVDWTAGDIALATEATPWPETGRPRRAGVSAFGISGTNAHTILEQAPEVPASQPEPPSVRTPVLPWVLSARGTPALRAQAARLHTWLADRPEHSTVDVAWSLSRHRALLEHRAVLVGASRDELLGKLELLASGELATETGAARPRRLAMVFSGQGSQRSGMGAELCAAFPAYANAFAEVCAEFDRHLDRPLRELVFDADPAVLERTEYTQPALFAMQTALYRLVNQWGVTPDLLLGHSIGELTAAHLAGVLSLPDACALVAARGRLMQAQRADGAMAAIEATEAELAPDLGAGADLAAVNGPRSVVISGDANEIERIQAKWRTAGRRTSALRVSHAFHSAHLDGMLADFRAVAQGISYAEPRIPLVSNLTGAIAEPGQLTDPEYWVRHVRATVRFADGVRAAEADGVTAVLELGPDAIAAGMTQESLADPAATVVLPALRRDQPEVTALTTALAELSAAGVALDWSAVLTGRGGRSVELPTYAFQGKRFWLSTVDDIVEAEPVATEPDLLAELAVLSEIERAGLLRSVVRRETARVLGYASAAEVPPEAVFAELGMDSLAVVRLRTALAQRTGLDLPLTITFDHPTAADLAEFLASKTGAGNPVDVLLRELDQVAAALPRIADGAGRARLAERVRELSALLGEQAGPEPVSDDELFQLIEEELGAE